MGEHAICIMALTGCGIGFIGIAGYVVALHTARVKELREDMADSIDTNRETAEALKALAERIPPRQQTEGGRIEAG